MNTSEAFRRECEARWWLAHVRASKPTRVEGEARMAQILADIAKVRGQPAADELRAEIDRQRAQPGAAA